MFAARAWLGTPQEADVTASAALYAASLVPAQVLVRGSGLDTSTPSYYAVSMTRGLQVQLVKVVDGVSTILDQIKSADYVSGQWVRATITARGSTLSVQIFRLDKAMYLNGLGQWQTRPAWALAAMDTALTGPGLVGLARSPRYSGAITFDDFRALPVFPDSEAPSVWLAAPATRTTLSGVVKLTANASDNVGVSKVAFYLDGTLRSIATNSPYQWAFDTTGVPNGTHSLAVLAYDDAGNVGKTSLNVTVENNALPQPAIPRHYPHIRIAELAYSGNPMGSFETQLLKNSVDLVIPDTAYLSAINSIAPTTPQLIYGNVSNLYLGLLTDWLAYADAHAISREQAFYHVTQATPFTGTSSSSQPVNWFWAAYRDGTSWTDLTSQARGTLPGGVAFGSRGQSVYLAYPEMFREINLHLGSGASGGWSAALEYVNGVDATGNPTSWGSLTKLTDTTMGLRQSGQITFDPPSSWKPASINGSAPLYFVRFRTLTSGTAPVANTILGRDYVQAHGTTSGTIPAFDSSADTDHDGYLDNTEYGHRKAGDNARFLYESRVFYGNYGQMRFAANPSNAAFRAWAVNYAVRYLNSHPLADGLFVDNSSGRPRLNGARVRESTSTYAADYGTMLNAIGLTIAPRWVLANTAGGASSADPIIQQNVGYFEEFALRPLAQNYQQFQGLAAEVAHRSTLNSPSPYAILDSLPTGGSPTDPGTQIATLASYYLIADPNTTFLDFFGGYEPSSSWTRHWSPAAAYDIGQPQGAWSVFATGADPSNPALTYRVYQRAYSNALVLYKPLSYADQVTGLLTRASATTFALGGVYRTLNADGTLGTPVTTVTLANGQGAILIKT
jgi:hypothetical protein